MRCAAAVEGNNDPRLSIGGQRPRAAHHHISAAVFHIVADLHSIQHHLPIALLPLPCLLLLRLLLLLLWHTTATGAATGATTAVKGSGAALLRTLWHLDALCDGADVARQHLCSDSGCQG